MENSFDIDKRKQLMELMNRTDSFFTDFGLLDDKAFDGGAISKKNKELCMIAVSIVTKCEECIIFHINESIRFEAGIEEIIEAVKMGMMAGGSTSYPYVRKAFAQLQENKLI